MIFAGFRFNISKTSFVLIVFAVVNILSSALRLMVILLPDPVYNTEYMFEPFAIVLIAAFFEIVGLFKTEMAMSFGFNADCIGNAADADEDATDVTQIGWVDVE